MFVIFAPKIAMAWSIGDPIAPNCPTCTTDASGATTCTNPCTITDFFTMLSNVYSFIVLEIAAPLAIIAMIIGGIFMLVSGGSPGLMATGKKIVITSIIGLVLVFASYLIISFLLNLVGFTGNWSAPFGG